MDHKHIRPTRTGAWSTMVPTGMAKMEIQGKEGTVRASLLVVALALTASLAAQVPVQDRQPAGSALRPAVMGPTGGVSTGHPRTTSAALEQDLYSLGGETLVLVY